MSKIIRLKEKDEVLYPETHASAIEGFKETLLNAVYPLGAVFMSINDVNPETFLGGTWERFANGRTLVGVNEGDSDFVANKTGGSKTHTHDLDAYAQMQISSTYLGAKTRTGTYTANVKATSFSGIAETAAKDQGVNISGKATSASSLQPYQTVYIWKRTA
ncbi:phage baseplate protein [Enterococcus sp. LJL128]